MEQSSITPMPTHIGRYPIEGIYSQGGMSLIFLATEPSSHEQIIIKVLLPQFLSNSILAKQFINEGRIIAMTDHPNIIKLYEYGEWEGGVFVAMELVKGTSLRKILQHNPLPLKKGLQVLLQVCYAISHLHNHGVIHGDLKPENVLLTDQDQVKVIDFGIARVLSEPETKESKRFAGTPIYMSPETQLDPKKCSVQSDIYSIGIISYELVMGQLTHGRVVLTTAPRGLQRILKKALQPKASDRYKEMQEFITDLAEYIHSGELEKDRQGADYFFELFEQLESEQKNLLTSLIPKTPDIGLTTSFGVGLNAVYYRTFQEKEKTTICMVEGNRTGVQGIIETFRLHTLFEHMNPLAALKTAAKQGILFRYSLLTIDHEKRRFTWRRHNWGMLFLTSGSTQEIAFNDEPIVEGFCDQNNRLILVGSTSPTLLAFSDSPLPPLSIVLTEAIQSSHTLEPQNQTSTILQKLRLRGDCIVDDHPICIFSIKC